MEHIKLHLKQTTTHVLLCFELYITITNICNLTIVDT